MDLLASVPEQAKDAIKFVLGGGLSLTAYKIYKAWTYKKRYDDVTDAQIRKELWKRLADMDAEIKSLRKELMDRDQKHAMEVIKLEKEKNDLAVDKVRLLNLHRECQQENAILEAKLHDKKQGGR